MFYCLWNFYVAGWNFSTLLAPVTLTSTRWPSFVYELNPYSMETYWICENDKDRGHTIRSVVVVNPMLRANLIALSFTEPELWSIELLYYRNKDFGHFRLLWPRYWPDGLHIRTCSVLPRAIPDVQIWTSYVKAFESYRLTDRQTKSTEIIKHATTSRVLNKAKLMDVDISRTCRSEFVYNSTARKPLQGLQLGLPT